jgi:hypothetical protein
MLRLSFARQMRRHRPVFVRACLLRGQSLTRQVAAVRSRHINVRSRNIGLPTT